MNILITLAIIGLIFSIGKFSIKQQLISKAFIDYSKPIGVMTTFVAGIMVSGGILIAIIMLLFFIHNTL